MDFLPENSFLEFIPNQLQLIRKEYDLDKPGRMEDAVCILNEWLQKQTHFKKKDFSNHYLESAIINCKGSIERAKTQLDKICTMRTLMPQFFGNYNVKTDFASIHPVVCSVVLPKLTDDYCRIYVSKLIGTPQTAAQFMDYFRCNIVLAEYLKANDYVLGFRIVVDFANINLIDVVTKINPIELRQALSIYIEGYGMKVKSIHLISPSKVIETLVSLLKQVLSPKIGDRIHVHKSHDELHKIISRRILPKDYNGEERSIKEMHAEWLDILSSEEHINTIREMNAAATDEACRPRDQFTEQYAGMPGTFRLLSVD